MNRGKCEDLEPSFIASEETLPLILKAVLKDGGQVVVKMCEDGGFHIYAPAFMPVWDETREIVPKMKRRFRWVFGLWHLIQWKIGRKKEPTWSEMRDVAGHIQDNLKAQMKARGILVSMIGWTETAGSVGNPPPDRAEGH